MRRALGKQESGFTLVELVMVIVLIGLLSYGGSSLFASRDAYSAFVAKDQLLSQALLAQQIALGGYRSGDGPVTLSVGVVGTDWTFVLTKPFTTATTADDEVITRTQSANGGSLLVNGTTLNAGDSQTFTWDMDGNLTVANNHEVRFVGEYTYRVCLSASGYAYESAGACP